MYKIWCVEKYEWNGQLVWQRPVFAATAADAFLKLEMMDGPYSDFKYTAHPVSIV